MPHDDEPKDPHSYCDPTDDMQHFAMKEDEHDDGNGYHQKCKELVNGCILAEDTPQMPDYRRDIIGCAPSGQATHGATAGRKENTNLLPDRLQGCGLLIAAPIKRVDQ